MAIDIMIGFSMMVVIVTGGLNLSVGAIGVCSAMTFGWLSERRACRSRSQFPARSRSEERWARSTVC